MSGAAQLWIAGWLFAVMALWSAGEWLMYRRRGVHTEALVVRKRQLLLRGRNGYKLLCQYEPPGAPVQMSEQSVGLSDWAPIADGETVRIIYNPKRPGRWILESALPRLAMAPLALGALAVGCFVAALMGT
jgi:hypothetical protein